MGRLIFSAKSGCQTLKSQSASRFWGGFERAESTRAVVFGRGQVAECQLKVARVFTVRQMAGAV